MAGTVAVTGASGFIGRRLTSQALAAGWQVRALSRRPESIDEAAGLSVLAGSLSSPQALERLIEGVDVVVHCAGLIKARRKRDFHEVNALGTASLVEVAMRQPRRPRLMLISSLAAREPTLSAYAQSKRQAETILAAEGQRLDWLVLRPPAVYGPGDTATLMLFRQMKRGFGFAPASREARFSLLYVDDLARAVTLLLDRPAAPHQVMELHDGRQNGYSWDDIAAVARQLIGRDMRWMRVPAGAMRIIAAGNSAVSWIAGRTPVLTPDKVREICHADWVCRNDLLDRLTPWRAEVDIRTGFERALAWYQAEGWL